MGQVEIVGVEVPGAGPAWSATLAHGQDPYQLAWEEGFKVLRPLSASGTVDHLTVTLQVCPHRRAVLPRGPQRTRSTLRGDEVNVSPVVRQRLAAYGIMISERGILATQFSDLTAVAGMWGLPGGGIDPGENPATTVHREAYEETGQEVEVVQFLDVQSDHWIGSSPHGVVEDFHAVRLIYAAHCPRPTDAVVHDVGGTTADSQWVQLDHVREVGWIHSSRALLTKHLPTVLHTWHTRNLGC
ncbi:MAG: NUDIX hydrolase [Propioniciclava sp.]